MPEELAGAQVTPQEGAVEAEERLLAPGTEGPQGLGYKFLAGAGFPRNEHRQVGGSQAGKPIEQGVERRVSRQDAAQSRVMGKIADRVGKTSEARGPLTHSTSLCYCDSNILTIVGFS